MKDPALAMLFLRSAVAAPNQCRCHRLAAAQAPPLSSRATATFKVGAAAMFTLVHKNFRSGEACKVKLAPGREIETPQGRISDIRWRLDFEDPNDPVIRTATAKIIRLNDGEIAFENDPPMIRYGYVLVRHDGIVDIVGDLTLWRSEELPEHLRDVTTPGHHIFDARAAAAGR
jgi:hypothetical protein